MPMWWYAEYQDTHPGSYVAAGFALLGKIASFVYPDTVEEKWQQCKVMEWGKLAHQNPNAFQYFTFCS